MSERGRERRGGGSAGGRGRIQLIPSQASLRDTGRGKGVSGRSDASAGYQPPHAASTSSAQSSPGSLASSTSSLSREVEQKLTVGSVVLQDHSLHSVQPQAGLALRVQSPAQTEQKAVQLPPASSKASRIPARPGYGAVGRKCVVRANHFLVQVADRDIYHYDVSITPEVISKKVCRYIVKELGKSQLVKHVLSYDGKKNIYTAGPLPFESRDFEIKLEDERQREFKVTVKFVAKGDSHHLLEFLESRQLDVPQETIQALDIVLRTTPSDKYQISGRSFFDPGFGKGELADGLEYWNGYYQSLRPTQMGLSLNIDVSAKAFYRSILALDYVEKYLNRNVTRARPLTDQERVQVKRALKGVKVEVSHMKQVRNYRVTGLSTQPIDQLRFPLDDKGTTISVVQYFREKYNFVLTQGYLPAINAGTDAKPTYLPMEICQIVEGQKYLRKLNEKQIVKNNNYDNDEHAKGFGLKVTTQLTRINARVLPSPTLKYHHTGRDAVINPLVGQWNMINAKMVNGGRVYFWSFVNFSRMRPDMVDVFIRELINMCRSKGMVFSPQPLHPIHATHQRDIVSTLVEIEQESTAQLARMGHINKHLQLLIIILPDASGSYGNIKRICETELGIVSQCCQPRQACKMSKQYLENLALKINVKVGGRNTMLLNPMFTDDLVTIIFGADVTHPQPGEDSSPSIAAVVASMDWPEVTKYRGLVSAQSHREEIVQDLFKKAPQVVSQGGKADWGMIRDQLFEFYVSTKRKPDRIIFYRDGVSEGQFNQVLLHEIDAIRKACQSLEAKYLPRITFVVVQKRHHTRLFPERHGDRNFTDKSGNILPGTVVDTTICHPTEFDFYLCSHAGIQGTSRPTHYHVLYDENNFTADALQILTNNLCYTYARCTRSVSIVPPAYYAHLAAFRARYYTEGEMVETDSASGGVRATREGNIEVRPLPAIKDNVKKCMFYC